MLQLGNSPSFGYELVNGCQLTGLRHLDRNRPLQFQIEPLPDLSEPTFGNEAIQAVATGHRIIRWFDRIAWTIFAIVGVAGFVDPINGLQRGDTAGQFFNQFRAVPAEFFCGHIPALLQYLFPLEQ